MKWLHVLGDVDILHVYLNGITYLDIYDSNFQARSTKFLCICNFWGESSVLMTLRMADLGSGTVAITLASNSLGWVLLVVASGGRHCHG